MTQAYTPGLLVTSRTHVTKLRELPLPGKVLVKIGESVEAHSPVLSAELPGDLVILRIADRLGLEPEDVLRGMKVSVGETVKKGQLVCSLNTFFNLLTSELRSPVDGVVEFFTEANSHIGIRLKSVPLQVTAYIKGVVTEIAEGKSVTIETDATVIQGIFGVGGERHGVVSVLSVPNDKKITSSDLSSLSSPLKGSVLFGGACYSIDALQFASSKGVSGIITGSIDSETLKAFVGYEIGVSITGDEDLPLTLIITEGFGNLAFSERIIDLARTVSGKFASINGATQVRAGAMRPEVIVPVSDQAQMAKAIQIESSQLVVGSRIRVIRVPYFGMLGTVSELPHALQTIPSGAKVRVLQAKLDNGESVLIPRANVELI